MASPLTVAPSGNVTFLGFPLELESEGLGADVAILGLPYGDPYGLDEVSNDQGRAPAAVRRASARAMRGLERWDFDLGGTLLDGQDVRLVDCGDVPGDARELGRHYQSAEHLAGNLLAAGVLPIIIGGDHGVPIPVLRAYEEHGPITLIQVDAHLDWRDEVNGVREGYSSPMRRASEMAHVAEIFQFGLRSSGSARAEDVAAALDYGAHLVPDSELQQVGMAALLERIPDGGRYYLTIDADGLDPAVMPAVAARTPGGLSFDQMRTLIHGLVAKGRVVGMDIVEITPRRDLNDISAITAARLIVNLIGMAVRGGYFGGAGG
ncbi:MAG TPA: agmatinase [Alphaproteobacteria bacterium]|jgi:agmatinase|nr:agmatinase [Alphaproteobacteria bacterium]MDP6271676.1 agmatinase [Alphaproteobacteria bacterium]MDP7164484.1 agmatinase [Alphaproteobacteria bacterium]MDP7429901.1 agmatinase [Alphaproteobacteria bacterium]HJM51060.1 agmatinase [Alphaproteobacteria bacterium]